MGSYEDRDVTLVDRSDVLGYGSQEKRYHWHIIRVGLDNVHPHTLILPQHYDTAAYQTLSAPLFFQPIHTLSEHAHRDEFANRYTIHAVAGHAYDIDATLTPEVTEVIGARFWPTTVEIHGKWLYVYSDDAAITETKTTALVDAAVWLSKQLSKN